MPGRPSNLIRVLELALCEVLTTPQFLKALEDGVTASEHIEVTEAGPLSEFTAEHGVAVKLRDAYSGRAQLFHLTIGSPATPWSRPGRRPRRSDSRSGAVAAARRPPRTAGRR